MPRLQLACDAIVATVNCPFPNFYAGTLMIHVSDFTTFKHQKTKAGKDILGGTAQSPVYLNQRTVFLKIELSKVEVTQL